MACRMYSLDELREKLTDREYKDVVRQIDFYQKKSVRYGVQNGENRKTRAPLICFLTYNGWLLPADKAGIKVVFPADSPFEI